MKQKTYLRAVTRLSPTVLLGI